MLSSEPLGKPYLDGLAVEVPIEIKKVRLDPVLPAVERRRDPDVGAGSVSLSAGCKRGESVSGVHATSGNQHARIGRQVSRGESYGSPRRSPVITSPRTA